MLAESNGHTTLMPGDVDCVWRVGYMCSEGLQVVIPSLEAVSDTWFLSHLLWLIN